MTRPRVYHTAAMRPALTPTLGPARLPRDAWLRRIAELDPERDAIEVYRITVFHEFPWDMNQALSFALFRTYAVPSIGALLARTGELTDRTRKRYEDTALILEAVLEHGFGSRPGRDAVRRMNQMHGAHAISNDDMRYVLSTFVVVPRRWLERYGWRPLTDAEVRASVVYYRGLGARMGITDLPDSYDGFASLLDDYEREHFAYDEGARRVADATLEVLGGIPPNDRLPARLVRLVSLSLMDPPLLKAFRLPHPPRAVRALVQAGLVARGRLLRLAPARREPRWVRDGPGIRGYRDGYEVAQLGTFPSRSSRDGGSP